MTNKFKNMRLTETQIDDLVRLIDSATEWHDFDNDYNEARRFDRIWKTLTNARN